MPHKPEPPTGYATLSLTHHAIQQSRAEAIRLRPGRTSARPECLSIGHAWTEDPASEGGMICIVCDVVRRP